MFAVAAVLWKTRCLLALPGAVQGPKLLLVQLQFLRQLVAELLLFLHLPPVLIDAGICKSCFLTTQVHEKAVAACMLDLC